MCEIVFSRKKKNFFPTEFVTLNTRVIIIYTCGRYILKNILKVKNSNLLYKF